MRRKETNEIKSINTTLYRKIQPLGGLDFDAAPDYWLSGASYEQCLHIYDYPTDVDRHWLTDLTNISNTVTSIDISTIDHNEVKTNINRSIQEQASRRSSAQNYGEASDAYARESELARLYEEVQKMGDSVKNVDVRVFLSDFSRQDMEERKKKIIENLDGDQYQATVFLNEGEREWRSLYQSYSIQQANNLFSIPGQPIQSSVLAEGNPFHFCYLEDPLGSFFGQTSTNGNFIWDPFFKSASRTHYNGLCCGLMGFGKSTFLKKLVEINALENNFVRIFDVSGEFRGEVEEFGGKIIKADGTQTANGIVNMWQIFQSGDNDSTSFSRHISKMQIIYRFLSPEAPETEVRRFSLLMHKLYEKFNLLPGRSNKGRKITGLMPNEYPITSDFITLVDDEIQELTRTADAMNKLELEEARQILTPCINIRDTFQELIKNYASIFEGYTSIENIEDEQIVSYDISDLKEMAPNIFDAQMYSLLWMCWSTSVSNGSIMKSKWENGEIEWEDIVRTAIICDEAHRWLNVQKLTAVLQVTSMMREGRKYFCGVWLASQQIRDFVPEGANDADLNQIKNLFELTQYKFIFRQDADTLDVIRKVFGETMTQAQQQMIPTLERGECIYCCSGENNMKIQIFLSDYEDKIFAGGA